MRSRSTGVGEPDDLGGVKFNYLANMKMPATFDPRRDQSATAYHPMQIHRHSRYEFQAGRPVFLLRSPDEITWVMQTFTDHIDRGLTESALPGLAVRLTLPDGWALPSYSCGPRSHHRHQRLAHIVSDDLANMYQGCMDGVANFDPWQ